MGKSSRVLKEMLSRDELLIGVTQQIISPEVTEVLCLSGLDFIIIDLEHTGKTIESAAPCIMAAYAMDVPAVVRVYEKEQCLIEQALDAGAQGVIVPTVETVEDCLKIVKAAKYAPEGERGWCGVIPAYRWLEADSSDFIDEANRKVFVGVLVETPEGMKNLPEMVKVKGIDAFLLGAGDYSIRVGKKIWDKEVSETIEKAMEVISDAGKLGIPIGLADNIESLKKKGTKAIQLGFNDAMSIENYFKENINKIRCIYERQEDEEV